VKKKMYLCIMLALGLTFAGCGKKEETADVMPETVAETVTETEAEEVETESETVVTEEAGNDILVKTGLASFEVISEDLQDGVWNQVITNTLSGSNVSPQISWEPVEGATCYAIYMTDTTAGNFIHWKSANVTETVLPQGWATDSDYIGPYPPPGATHDYDIYVVALKNPVERAKGAFKSSNPNFEGNVLALDTDVDGATGNMIAYGYLTGTYTAK
jgi:phosphatidylethanolamine-binding protein (PEBP) family uncharacterized protein